MQKDIKIVPRCARDNLRGQKSLGPLKMSLETAQKVIVPQKKKIMSRIFLNSGTLIVKFFPPKESFVSDIQAGDSNVANNFLQCPDKLYNICTYLYLSAKGYIMYISFISSTSLVLKEMLEIGNMCLRKGYFWNLILFLMVLKRSDIRLRPVYIYIRICVDIVF